MRRPFLVVLFLVIAVAAGLAACGGRPAVQPPPADLGVVAGRVFKGPVRDSVVIVYRLDGLARGAIAGQATTDADGAFRVAVGTATGPFLVVAQGGSYIDEATAVTVQLGNGELTALVPAFDVGTKADVRVTPVSHLAAGLALRWAATEGKTLVAADAEAWQHLNAHFGALDWRVITPTDLTVAGPAVLDDPGKAGLVLSALSMEARLIAEADGLTPGGRVQSLTLTQALYEDLSSDGFLDGVGAASAHLILPAGGTIADAGVTATALDGQTARTALGQAIARFLASDRNGGQIKLADAQQLITSIATASDARIFRGSSGPADVEPPAITWVKPSQDMSGVHGIVELEVRATDNVSVRSFAFSAPASLVATAAAPTPDGKTSTLRATLDVSSLPDGALALTVKAVDDSHNEKTSTLTVLVSNHGPAITITAPVDSTTVRGTVTLAATAVAQAGSIAKLELRNGPQGVGTDSLPAADAYTSSWDTTRAAEGPVTLTFHAEDTLGGVTDSTVTVTVDNVPFGTVRATTTLGAPVSGLSVQLVALDDANGQPLMGRPGGAILGQTAAGTSTDDAGVVTFVLSQENYVGPVQLVATGSQASYVDPSDPDGGVVIALPASFALTTILKAYRTGDALDVPLTGWTTLADEAAIAYAQGRNATSPTAHTLTASLATIEPLFAAHLTHTTSWSARSVFPVSLTAGPQSLRDVTIAAFPDVGLNELARDIAGEVGLTPGTGYALPALFDSLRLDIRDGQFDGRAGSLQLVTGGATPYSLDANATRFRLAISLDRFIRSSANRTGLTRADLQTQAIYDTVTGDTSLLYPASAAPIPFDNMSPAITWSATFANGGSSGLAPVGASRVVAGVLSLDALASDMSGVASLSVTANGQPLTAGPGSSSSHFTAPFTTTVDGTVTFVATACDRLANCGPSIFTATVDNTAPAVTILKPLAGFYSAAFDVEANATDANGLATFAPQPTSMQVGLVDQDTGALARVYAPSSSWTVAAGAPDGAFPVALKACDVVGNCATSTVTPTLDRTAPAVTITSTTPQYTNASTLTVTATFADAAAGVARAKALNLGISPQSPVPGVCTPTSGPSIACSFTVPLVSDSANSIVVWGEDAAAPSNGSATSTAAVTISVTRDATPPVMATRPVASYRDERGMTVATTGTGAPVMPVQYQYAGAPVTITEGSTVYKIKSKTAVTDANTPYLRWAVQTQPAPASPTAGCTWVITTLNGAPADQFTADGTLPSGALRASATTEGGYTLWELVLQAYLGDAAYTVTCADQAGNTTSRSFTLRYTLVGAPLVVVQDANYRTAYAGADNFWASSYASGYSRLIGTATNAVRWVVYNPNAEQVFVGAGHSGSTVAWQEYWPEADTGPAGAVTADGATFAPHSDWWSEATVHWGSPVNPSVVSCDLTKPSGASPGSYSSVFFNIGCSGVTAFPCDPTTAPVHYAGDPTQFRCEPRTNHTTGNGTGLSGLNNVVAAAPAVLATAPAAPTGGETATATAISFPGLPGFSMPAATSVTPTTVALYAQIATPSRPAGIAAQSFPLSPSFTTQTFVAGWMYRGNGVDCSPREAAVGWSAPACQVAGAQAQAFPNPTTVYFNYGWDLRSFARTLSGLTVSYSGALLLRTAPAYGTLNGTSAAVSNWPNLTFAVNR
jgi:hypothetical protein